jgi:hypothetical protein
MKDSANRQREHHDRYLRRNVYAHDKPKPLPALGLVAGSPGRARKEAPDQFISSPSEKSALISAVVVQTLWEGKANLAGRWPSSLLDAHSLRLPKVRMKFLDHTLQHGQSACPYFLKVLRFSGQTAKPFNSREQFVKNK